MQNIVSENDVIFTKWVHGKGPDNLGAFFCLIITDIFSIIYHFNSALNMQQPSQTLIPSQAECAGSGATSIFLLWVHSYTKLKGKLRDLRTRSKQCHLQN